MLHRSTCNTKVPRPRGGTESSSFSKTIAKSFLIAAVLIAALAVAANGDDVLAVGGHTFEFLGVVYNKDGTSTWTYRVTSGSKPSLSHWVLEFGPELTEDNVVKASELFEVGVDPRTGLYGFKFDKGYNDGETREVFFTLDAHYAPVETRIGIKAGQNVEIGKSIPGPRADGGDGNHPPEAIDDEATTKQNKVVRISVLDNDSDPDGDNLNIDSFTQPGHGTVKKSGKKKLQYTPEKGFNGVDTFTYTISDGNGGTSTATVTVTVGTISEKPEAGNDSAVTDEGVPVDIDVLANDSDSDGTIDPTSVAITVKPKAGSVSVDPTTGLVTYTPGLGKCGDDHFRYTVKDDAGLTSDEAKVDVVVTCNEAPQAHDDEAVSEENASVEVDVIANDTDADGSIDPTSVTITADPKHGSATVNPATGAVTYTPDPGYCGSDSFEYTVDDNDGETSDEATVRIDVLCNEAPEAVDDVATTDENTSVGINVIANDTDSDGSIDPTTIVIVKDPKDGSVSVHPSTGVITYTPDPGSCGVDTFRYTIDDDDGETSNEAKVEVEVLCNEPPLAIDDLYTVNEGGTLAISAPGVLLNDVDTPGSPLTAILVGSVEYGSLELRADGSFVYTHDGSETTSDEFTYIANDGQKDSNVAAVSIVIVPTNDPPQANDDEDDTEEDVPVRIDVLDNDSDPDGDDLSVDWVTQPDNGAVTNNGRDVTYTPDPDFHGVDSFTYGVFDGNGGTAAAEVTVSVTTENDPPVAQDDSDATDEDVPVTIDVLDNDSDPDGDGLVITSVKQPENGDVDNNGVDVTYTPEPGFNGVDTFTYTIDDGNGGKATATVTVTIAAVNDPPIAEDDADTTVEDVPVTIDVLDNDSDPDGDDLIVQSVTQPANGSVANNGSDVTYTPNPDFNGPDSFTYTVSDGNGETAQATVIVTVEPVNDRPIAQDDSDVTDEDVPVTIDILDNDSDPDGDDLIVQSVTQPANGSANNNGSDVTYTPDEDFNGSDSFTYTVSDGNGETAQATVIVTVEAVNDQPIAQDDSDVTDEDVPVTIDVLDNDSDPDGDDLVIQSVTQPANGSVTNNGSDVTYTPDPDFNGSDSFSYTVSDGNGETARATVIVTVEAVNDQPIAQDDSDVTDEDVSVTIDVLNNDSDPDGDDLVIQSVTQPANGSVTTNGSDVTYTPDPGFNGSDSFSYTVSDGSGGTDTATVTVAVATVNDAPIAQDDFDVTDEDVSVTIDVLNNDSDPDGDDLVIQSATQPANGTVTNNGSDITYTPAPGFNSSDSFSYTVSDGNGETARATVFVTVEAVNDHPVAQDDSGVTDEDVPVTIDVLDNDNDPDGDDLVVQSVTQPANGTVTTNGSNVTYTPDPGFNGSDSFTYTVSDGNGGTDTATVTIAVATVNDAPIAVNDSDTTAEDVPVTIDVLNNDSDPDGDDLVIQSVSQPDHGTIVNAAIDVIYTPDPGFNGSDSFSYTVSDGNGGTDTATVEITIEPVNDPPIAQDDSAATDEDVPVTIDVLVNDSDPDGDDLIVQSVTQPANGSVINNGSDVTYAPDPGFSGTDTFTYTISDGSGETATATVSVAVALVNEPPEAEADKAETDENSPVTIPILANDSDPDGDTIAVESVTQPVHGSVAPLGVGAVYTPNPGFSGTDTFTYTITDGHGGKSTATVTIEVLATNDPPVAQDDSRTITEDTEVTIPVLVNDSDPDGDDLLVESVTQPDNGVVINNGDDVTYIPDPGFSGTDIFQYTVSDGKGKTDTATVIITISSVNNPPLAQDDSATTSEGTMVLIPVLENDGDPDGDFLLVEAFGQPANGSVLNARTGISYIPNPGFEGIDTFTYVVSDGNGGTDTATVTVSVAGANAPPSAGDDNAVTNEGVPVTISVLLNDSDPDGDTILVESVTAPEDGAVSNDGTRVTYTPAPGFSGVDQFTYTISDGVGGIDTATVFVAVAPVNDPPVAQDDSATTKRETTIAVPVLQNDSDPDADPIFIESVTQPTNGTVSIDGLVVSYRPNDGFTGTDTFTYTLSDGRGHTDTATVTIGVAGEAGAGGAAAETPCEGKVIISEIAWAGTAADPRDEWIELRNLGTTPVNLDGWVLQWRRSRPSTPEEHVWKVVELSGVLRPSSGRVCNQETPIEPVVRLYRDDPSDISWLLSSEIDDSDSGFFILEHRHDGAISNMKADLLYDTSQALILDLSDLGEVIMLVNDLGEIVDTANASRLGRDGWVAGSSTTYGTMERVDPLGPDTAYNWYTNMGIVANGEDAMGHLLRATPGALNSPVLEDLDVYAGIAPATVRAGELLRVEFPLPRQDRRKTGWPWISVSRPGFVGAGGAADLAGYSFSGRYEGGDRYVLDIGTKDLAPGTYLFWVIYGEGKAVLVSIILAP